MSDSLPQDEKTIEIERPAFLVNQSKAENIVRLARKKGEMVLKNAQIQAMQIKEKAFADGFQEGVAKGLAQGKTEGKKEFEEKSRQILADVKKKSQDYENYLERLMDSLEPRIMDLVMVVAKAVIRKETEYDENFVLRTIKDAVRDLSKRDAVILMSHFSEIEKIGVIKNEIISSSNNIESLEILPGEDVERGGVMLIAPSGIIDARIKSQMEVANDILNNS